MADVPTSPDAEMRPVAKFAWNQPRGRLQETHPDGSRAARAGTRIAPRRRSGEPSQHGGVRCASFKVVSFPCW